MGFNEHTKGVAQLYSTAPGTHSTEEVAEVLRRGSMIDDAGFAVLYRHYQPSLTKYAARRGSSEAEGCADLAMFDGYKVISKGRMRDQSEPAFRAYLYQATDGHIANELRRARPSTIEITDDLPVEGDHASDAVDQLWLEELINDLSDAQRDTIRGRFLLDLDAGEVGRLLNKDPNAIHQLQHRAIRRLRKILLTMALVVAALVGALAIRGMLSAELSIDTTPIDRPSTTTTTLRRADLAPSPNQREAETTDVTDDAPLAEPTLSADADVAVKPGSTDPATSSSTTTDQATAATGPPPPAATTVPSTTIAPATVTTVQTPPPLAEPFVLVPPNICASERISSTLWQHRLRTDPEDPQVAATFAPPAAVRFVNDAGDVLHMVDTSGPMLTGLRPNNHGWLSPGDTNGTFASYEQTPQPAFWGVVTTVDAVDGWTAIQFPLEGTSIWVDILNCR